MMEKNMFYPNLSETSVAKLVKKTISILRAQAECMRLELQYEGPEHGYTVKVDKTRV